MDDGTPANNDERAHTRAARTCNCRCSQRVATRQTFFPLTESFLIQSLAHSGIPQRRQWCRSRPMRLMMPTHS